MANRAREDTQRERADARERRRATKSQPFETLEDAVDSCETVANVLEGVCLKQRRAPRR
jgi:hypothetical protein